MSPQSPTPQKTPLVRLDHLVVAARTLDEGTAWVQHRLGVTVPRGGAHDHMATHNCVGRIGDDIYLEIIAINPDDTPDRARWFSMDTPEFHDRLEREGAFLHHWAVNTSDMTATLGAAHHDPGPAMAMSRGELRWDIAVRDDGLLARDGIIPTVIGWPDDTHPSRAMSDLGIRFAGLAITTPDIAGTTADLTSVGADSFADVSEGPVNQLTAHFTVGDDRLSL